MRSKNFSSMSGEQLDLQLGKFLEFCKAEKWVIHHIQRGYFQWNHEGNVLACHHAIVLHEMLKNGGNTMEENKQDEVKEEVKAPEAEVALQEQAPEALAEAPCEAPCEAPAEAEAPKEEAPAEAQEEEKKEESNA